MIVLGNYECLCRFFICFCFLYSSFHNLYEICKQCNAHAYHIYATLPALTLFAMHSYFACCFMNLKCYLHWHLSRIISWYCSNVNTILTSKYCTPKCSPLLPIYMREISWNTCTLFFSSQFWIYILSYTRPFFFAYDKACWWNELHYLFFQILPLFLL